jgi:hypothetical protein
MPTNITDVSTFSDPVVGPADGDTRNASSVLTGLQHLANRTRWIYDLLTSTGIGRVRTVASVGALKALASPSPGDVVILLVGIPQVYIFRSVALAGTDITGMRYDSTTVAGQWVSPWFYLADVSGTFAPGPRLDVQVLPPPNRVVDIPESIVSSPSSLSWTSGGTWRALDASLASVSLQEGDIVYLSGSCTWSTNDAVDGEVDFRLYVSAPGGAGAVDGTLVQNLLVSGADKRQHMNLNGRYRVTGTGVHTFTMELLGSGAAPFDFFVFGNRTLRAIIFRP